MKIKVAIVNYGVGNLYSVYNSLQFLGYDSVVANTEEELKKCNSLILPGVGSFGKAMEIIKSKGIDLMLNEQVVFKKKPILGICLGMQLLVTSSEENGNHEGLNWIEGKVKLIKASKRYPVPHVGWDQAIFSNPAPLFSRFTGSPLFYYDHSYHVICDPGYVTSHCPYGNSITASIQKENIFGIQFHPEKSQNNGLKLLKSFINYSAQC